MGIRVALYEAKDAPSGRQIIRVEQPQLERESAPSCAKGCVKSRNWRRFVTDWIAQIVSTV